MIDIGKPLPSIGGEQSRIAVDVGIRNTEVKAGKNLDRRGPEEAPRLQELRVRLRRRDRLGRRDGRPDAEEFSFLFVEVHYEGKTPLFTLGPVGFYGLGGLFGHNIAPGIPPGQQSAVGIANWIFGDGKGSFTSVKDWPSGEPTPATWHPDRDFVNDKDRYAFGLFVKAGSVGDGGKSVSVDSIVMVGFPEFWLAIAGFAIIKPINAELTVVIVYDHPSRSFVVKVAFNYKIDKENGRIVDMKNVLEIGTTKTPKRRWFYLGHYADDKGGPGGAELFKLINTKFYVVYDTQGTDKFGIVLVENPKVKPPAIPGPLFGFGALYQFGPKTYGPSWLNISLFAGFGFNVAVGSNPFLIYGDIYAVGHVQVKIAIFKGKLGFAARLYGIASEDFYRFAGEIEVRINLPWPLSDISESFDFVIEGGRPAVPAAGHHHDGLGARPGRAAVDRAAAGPDRAGADRLGHRDRLQQADLRGAGGHARQHQARPSTIRSCPTTRPIPSRRSPPSSPTASTRSPSSTSSATCGSSAGRSRAVEPPGARRRRARIRWSDPARHRLDPGGRGRRRLGSARRHRRRRRARARQRAAPRALPQHLRRARAAVLAERAREALRLDRGLGDDPALRHRRPGLPARRTDESAGPEVDQTRHVLEPRLRHRPRRRQDRGAPLERERTTAACRGT